MPGNDAPNAAALFEAANKLRGSVESAEYKHLVLGLIFLKYISDAFEARRKELEAELADPKGEGYLESETDPALAEIAHDLVRAIRADLTIDWADREATEAKVRAKIKRLLRQKSYEPPGVEASGSGGGGRARHLDEAAQLVLDQAKALYRRWPEVEIGDSLPL